jgi:hypothetical protein
MRMLYGCHFNRVTILYIYIYIYIYIYMRMLYGCHIKRVTIFSKGVQRERESFLWEVNAEAEERVCCI